MIKPRTKNFIQTSNHEELQYPLPDPSPSSSVSSSPPSPGPKWVDQLDIEDKRTFSKEFEV